MKKTIVMRLVKNYVEKNTPFIIMLYTGDQSKPLRFIEEDTDCIIVEVISDGILAAYNYEHIANLLPLSNMPSLQTNITKPLAKDRNLKIDDLEDDYSEYWQKEYKKAQESIHCNSLKMIDRRDTVKASVRNSIITKDWGRIYSMFNDAKKNHSLEQKSPKIIKELNSLPQCTEVKISLGMVYAALNKFDTAAKEYYNGGDYHNAAYCAIQCNDGKAALNYLKCIIKAKQTYDDDVLSAFFFLCKEYNEVGFCAANFQTPDPAYAKIVFHGLLMLYKTYDNNFSRLGKASTEYLYNISIIIDRLNTIKVDENKTDVTLTNYTSISELGTGLGRQVYENDKYELLGEIQTFIKLENNAYGFIDTKDEKHIYFNIRQVEDERLRDLLWNDYLTNVKVSLTLGLGTKDGKVADHIKLFEDLSDEEISSFGKIYDGMTYSYGNYDKYGNRYGVIYCDNKDILFRDEAVIDPILKAYFDNSFSVKDLYVKFTTKKINNNRIAIKIWLDTDKEKKIIDEYYNYVSKEAYDKFIETKKNIENTVIIHCPFGYVALPIWQDDSGTDLSDTSRINEVKTSIIKPSFESHITHLNINDLLTKGVYYLTSVKNLEKAESFFLAALNASPERSHINTAVSNLVTIYQQENRTDDALNILLKYRNKIGEEKYNNHLIQIYDKSKQYDALIDILKQVIPNAKKARLHRIKQMITCYLKTNRAKEAIQVLKDYRKYIDEFSYNNLYSTILEIMDNYEELESFLKKAVENTYRSEHKLNYMNKLANFYQKNGKMSKAINTYEQWKKYYNSNRSNITMSTAVAAVAKLENDVDRNLCILYYISEKVEEAKSIAKSLLRKNSEDSVAQQILDETYVPSDNVQHNVSSAVDDYVTFEGIGDKVPKLLEWMLNNIDYERCLYNTDIIKNIKGSKYIASESQAREDIDSALDYFENRNYTEKSTVYLALAKIIKQFVDSGQNDKYFTQKKLNLFLGKSLMLKADADMQSSNQNRESSRYYYFLSLRYLSRTDDEDSFYHAFNMLYLSFFLSDNELADVVSKKEYEKKLCETPPEYQESVIAVKEFMTCMFDLDLCYSKSRIPATVRKVIDSAFKHNRLRKSFADTMTQLCNVPDYFESADVYYRVWRSAKKEYNKTLNALDEYIRNAANSVSEPEKLNRNLNNILTLDSENILSKTDTDNLKKIIGIFKLFQKRSGLTMIRDLLETLDSVVEQCEALEQAICQEPTDFSYEKLLDSVTMLKDKALKNKNKLYSDSKPNLSVYPEYRAFYKNSNQTQVKMYVENKGNVQNADISNIVLSGKNNDINIIGNPEHTITTVHGNEISEYTVNISFSENERRRQVFDVEFSFDYSYYDESGESVKECFKGNYQINLLMLDSFTKIENKYKGFAEAGAVSSDDMFYGREKEINGIVGSLSKGDGEVLSHRGIYMYGQKRAGKSSIMARLEKRINEQYPGKYIILNLGSAGITEINNNILHVLKIKIINKLMRNINKNYPDKYEKLKKDFQESIKAIKENPESTEFEAILDSVYDELPDKVIMIFIDEFNYIYTAIKKGKCTVDFPRFWKALLQNYNMCSIVAGQDDMVNFIQDYKNEFACMSAFPVSYLEEVDAKKLISDPMSSNGVSRFEDDALELIYKLTAGSAYLIMIFCDQLVDYMNEKGTSRVTKTTVEIFVEKWLFNSSENNHYLNDQHFDAQINDPNWLDTENQKNQDNKIVLSYIANHANYNNQIRFENIKCNDELSDKSPEYLSRLIEQLVKRRVLICENNYYRILVDLLRIYLRREV